jgi:hypothetical protein
MNDQYTAEFVFKTFTDIDQGHYHNAHFSHANVVIVSKEHYYRLVDACLECKEPRFPGTDSPSASEDSLKQALIKISRLERKIESLKAKNNGLTKKVESQ